MASPHPLALAWADVSIRHVAAPLFEIYEQPARARWLRETPWICEGYTATEAVRRLTSLASEVRKENDDGLIQLPAAFTACMAQVWKVCNAAKWLTSRSPVVRQMPYVPADPMAMIRLAQAAGVVSLELELLLAGVSPLDLAQTAAEERQSLA